MIGLRRPAVAALIALCGAPLLAGPLRVFEVDFDDPAEAGRWRRHPLDDSAGQISWELTPRSSSEPSLGNMLRVRASRGLSENVDVQIYREFPPEFQPDTDKVLVFDWEWRIADTEVSDAVGIAFAWAPFDGSPRDALGTMLSHSRFTFGWRVLFDPAERWVHHRIGGNWKVTYPRLPIGILLSFTEPARQVADIARLRIEEWDPGEFDMAPTLVPRRVAADEPFQERPLESLRRAMGGALEDLNGDGLPELLVVERLGYPHLYRNDGAGRFDAEVPRAGGMDTFLLGTGALFADFDGDGDADVVITSEYEVPRLFENTGGLRFRERARSGDESLGQWYVAAADDLDRDGRLDLVAVGPLGGKEGFVFRYNEGDWRFRLDEDPVSIHLVENARGVYGVTLADLDDDDRPDWLLTREQLFLTGGGSPQRRESWSPVDHASSEGTVVADLTGDGRLDLLVVRDDQDSAASPTRLFAGRGGGEFFETTAESGLLYTVAGEVALAEDFDNDGDLDLYFCRRMRANQLLLNDGRGRFREVTEGSGFEDQGACDGAVAGDLDGNGGIDVAIFRHGAVPRLIDNRLARGHWLGVQVRGPETFRHAVGTRVAVIDRQTGREFLVRWVRAGRGFGSNGPSELRFGLGERQLVDIEARFPDGSVRRIDEVRADRTILLSALDGGFAARTATRLAEARFPVVRAWSGAIVRRPWIGAWVAVVGLGLGAVATVAGRGRQRSIALVALASGVAAALPLGTVAGAGWKGVAVACWTVGALAGVLAARGVAVARAMRLRLATPSTRAFSAEDLTRHTLDFRHAGIETRTLLAIHGRVQNLFIASRLHRGFLSDLRAHAARFAEGTGASLRLLVERVRAVDPAVAAAVPLESRVEQLEQRLRELERIGEDEAGLEAWRGRTLAVLEATQRGLSELLLEIDRLCSCDVLTTIAEAREVHAEALGEIGAEIVIRSDAPPDGLRAVISRGELLVILENLFANALHAVRGRSEPRIGIHVRDGDRRITLEFQDNGRGVSATAAGSIFEYGFTTKPDGRGYGLARSREIARHFGGDLVLADPDPETGARFVMTLRVAPRD